MADASIEDGLKNAMREALTGGTPAAAPTPAPETAADATSAEPAKPAPPIFVGGKPRTQVVPLSSPLEYDGKLWSEVTIKRLTARQVDDFIEAVGRGESPPLPLVDAPPEVLDALDADDAFLVNKAIDNFFPSALRTGASDSGTSASSPASLPGGSTSMPIAS